MYADCMNQSLSFTNPEEFTSYLRAQLETGQPLSADGSRVLLEGCVQALDQVLDANRLYVSRLIASVNCLNSAQPSWGHMLSELYTIFECGMATPEEMNQILRDEVCPKA